MSGFVDTMHLKGKAEEDVWFARRDKELKAALQRKKVQSGRPESKQGRTSDEPPPD